jgi:hypothetical protein
VSQKPKICGTFLQSQLALVLESQKHLFLEIIITSQYFLKILQWTIQKSDRQLYIHPLEAVYVIICVEVKSMTTYSTIYTLNNRGNVFLEVMENTLNLNSNQMYEEINLMLVDVKNTLSYKGIEYNNLKNILTPNVKKKELALIFDTRFSNAYGYNISKKLLELLSKNTKCAVLVGDCISSPLPKIKMTKASKFYNIEFRPSDYFFVVYITNLTVDMVDALHHGLDSYKPYIGYVDATHSSYFKTYLSTILCQEFLKYENIIIHNDEADVFWPVEEFGYITKGITSYLYDIFLVYKIEAPVFFANDIRFALNSISPTQLSLNNLEVCLTREKLDYIKNKNKGGINKAELTEITKEEFEVLIRSKISSNYIYNLEYQKEYNLLKFTIIVEIPTKNKDINVRFNIGLKHTPGSKSLEIVTVF